MDRAARGVALEARQVERLRHHTLGREGRIAVDQHRKRHGSIDDRFLASAIGLVRPRPPLYHRVHRFEVTRIGRERDVHRLARSGLVDAVRAVVVLHVARAPFRGERLLHVPAAFELRENRLVRKPDDVRQDVQAAPMRHAQHDTPCAAGAGPLDGLVEHRHQDVEPLDREALLAQVGLVQEPLERFDRRQTAEQFALLFRRERFAVLT